MNYIIAKIKNFVHTDFLKKEGTDSKCCIGIQGVDFEISMKKGSNTIIMKFLTSEDKLALKTILPMFVSFDANFEINTKGKFTLLQKSNFEQIFGTEEKANPDCNELEIEMQISKKAQKNLFKMVQEFLVSCCKKKEPNLLKIVKQFLVQNYQQKTLYQNQIKQAMKSYYNQASETFIFNGEDKYKEYKILSELAELGKFNSKKNEGNKEDSSAHLSQQELDNLKFKILTNNRLENEKLGEEYEEGQENEQQNAQKNEQPDENFDEEKSDENSDKEKSNEEVFNMQEWEKKFTEFKQWNAKCENLNAKCENLNNKTLDGRVFNIQESKECNEITSNEKLFNIQESDENSYKEKLD